MLKLLSLLLLLSTTSSAQTVSTYPVTLSTPPANLDSTHVLRKELDELNLRIQIRALQKELDAELHNGPVYTTSPFDASSGILTISDRRINFDGPIMYGAADYIDERLQYFNNASSTLPVFLVISNSPGGSVMEGYRVLTAIKASSAPVHVVVKSFAASMAAVIVTSAEYSYAYPDAIVLHHQLSYSMQGNVAEHSYYLSMATLWSERLLGPIAEKLGYSSVNRFVEAMYQHSLNGDWAQFGDQAAQSGWVNVAVTGVRETHYRTKPREQQIQVRTMFLGQQGGVLPPLHAFDIYYLHDLQNKYVVGD